MIPVEELEAGLWAICDNVSSLPSSELDAPVGNLTGSSRDAWTVSREHLISLSPSNRASLNAVEDSLFTLCLDDSTRVLPPGQDSLPASSSGKSTSVGLDAHIVSASANGDGSNRWFDKSFQVIVENNSRGSLNGEHSPCDALIPSIVSDYAQAEGVGKGGVEGWESVREKGRKGEWGGGWTRLRFVVDGKTEAAIAEAKKEISEIQKDSDGKMLWFDDYGADWIKKQGPFPVLLGVRARLMEWVMMQASNRRTRTSRWRCSWRGTASRDGCRPRTRRPRPGCSERAGPTSSGR